MAAVTVLVVGAALVFWACVFAVYFASVGVTPVEFFLGGYEPTPPDLGVWKDAGLDPQQGLLVEERWLLPQDRANARYLLRQVRYREPTTRAIVRAEPEQRVLRQRAGRGTGFTH